MNKEKQTDQKVGIERIKRSLKPYSGIILFLVLLFFFHFSWKIAIDGDHEGDQIFIFGKDCTPAWFGTVTLWLAQAVHWLVRLFPGSENFMIEGNILYYIGGGFRNHVIWGCTGLKQMFIFSGIMFFYRGPFLKKLWYIPMGCLILTLYNIVRIALISVFTNRHAERFDMLHDGIFRFIYYGIVFLLWLVWEEFIVNKKKKNEKDQPENRAPAAEDAG